MNPSAATRRAIYIASWVIGTLSAIGTAVTASLDSTPQWLTIVLAALTVLQAQVALLAAGNVSDSA